MGYTVIAVFGNLQTNMRAMLMTQVLFRRLYSLGTVVNNFDSVERNYFAMFFGILVAIGMADSAKLLAEAKQKVVAVVQSVY
jgi:hypothetical protein